MDGARGQEFVLRRIAGPGYNYKKRSRDLK